MLDQRAGLLNIYRSTPTTLRALIRDLSDEQVRTGGEGDEAWSIVEVVCHLRDTEDLTLGRVRLMRDEDRPRIVAWDQEVAAAEGNYRAQSLDTALADFTRLRAEQVATLEALDADAWQRTGLHDEVGEITIQQLTAYMAAHDAIHLAQIARRIQDM